MDVGLEITKSTEKSQKPIYTLACAMRKKSRFLGISHTQTLSNNTQLEIDQHKTNENLEFPHKLPPQKENNYLKENINRSISKYHRSTLPMNMIVSKMATRKQTKETLELQHSDLLADCRNYKLTPPSWHNNRHFKRLKPTKMERMIKMMKEKSSQCNTQNETVKFSGKENILSFEDLEQNAPNIDSNIVHHQFYGKRAEIDDAAAFDSVDASSRNSFTSTEHSKELTDDEFEPTSLSSSVSREASKFVWNPVILNTIPTNFLNSLSHNERIPCRNRQQNNTSINHPINWSRLSTTSSPSSSSGLTIEEEKLHFTYFSESLPGRYSPRYNQTIPRMFEVENSTDSRHVRAPTLFMSGSEQHSGLCRHYEE